MSSETYKSFDLIIRSDELNLKYFEKYYGSDNYDLLIKEDNNLDFKCFWSKSNYSDFLITENGVIVLIKDVGIFRIFEGKLITWNKANNNVTEDDLITFLLGSVLSICLIQRGLLVLHANALEKDGKSIICLGESGSGKSTLACILMQQGWNLLADDLVAINDQDFVLPGVSRIKLWANSLKELDIQTTNLEKVRPSIEKYHIPRKMLKKANKPVKVNTIYLIERDPNSTEDKLHIKDIKDQKLSYLLIREHIYKPFLMKTLGLEGEYFKKLTKFQKIYPVKILKLPNNILKTLKQLDSINL